MPPIWRAETRLHVANTLGPSIREEAIAVAREARDLAEVKSIACAVATGDL